VKPGGTRIGELPEWLVPDFIESEADKDLPDWGTMGKAFGVTVGFVLFAFVIDKVLG
jgi:hypothetical protein